MWTPGLTARRAERLGKGRPHAVRRQFEDSESGRLLLSGLDEVPQGFKELVEEYYRALSNRNR